MYLLGNDTDSLQSASFSGSLEIKITLEINLFQVDVMVCVYTPRSDSSELNN